MLKILKFVKGLSLFLIWFVSVGTIIFFIYLIPAIFTSGAFGGSYEIMSYTIHIVNVFIGIAITLLILPYLSYFLSKKTLDKINSLATTGITVNYGGYIAGMILSYILYFSINLNFLFSNPLNYLNDSTMIVKIGGSGGLISIDTHNLSLLWYLVPIIIFYAVYGIGNFLRKNR